MTPPPNARGTTCRRRQQPQNGMVSDFERIGAESLRAIIDDFVNRCFDDLMIGFMFQRANRERIKKFEYQHAATFLGSPDEYEGRDLRKAHAAHRVNGGQFMRRLQILRETLDAHQVPTEVRDRWLAHHESLRGEITDQPGSSCR